LDPELLHSAAWCCIGEIVSVERVILVHIAVPFPRPFVFVENCELFSVDLLGTYDIKKSELRAPAKAMQNSLFIKPSSPRLVYNFILSHTALAKQG
jgi:hypothetical protein